MLKNLDFSLNMLKFVQSIASNLSYETTMNKQMSYYNFHGSYIEYR